MNQLLMALCYLHKNKIIHKDIKSENILFSTEKGKALKLFNFGISKKTNNKND